MHINIQDLRAVLGPILPQILAHKSHQNQTRSGTPFLLCLSGLQGSGKSTWASSISNYLLTESNLKVVVLSLDDLYLDHSHLVNIRERNPTNKLLSNRGQPGTHDVGLAQQFFSSLDNGEDLKVPAFDKSRFGGEGDRVSKELWECVPADPPIDVIIFEGWSLGFRWLHDTELEEKWRAAQNTYAGEDEDEAQGYSIHTLRDHPFEHVQVINANLRKYNETFMNPERFNYLIHLDTDKLVNVYYWRIDQERALRRAKGTGMTDSDVVRFVQGYMPAYELYRDRLQKESFIPRRGENRTQLRVVLNADRKVVCIDSV